MPQLKIDVSFSSDDIEWSEKYSNGQVGQKYKILNKVRSNLHKLYYNEYLQTLRELRAN